MLVYIDCTDGKPRLAGNCDVIELRDLTRHDVVYCPTLYGMKQYRIGHLEFASRPNHGVINVLRLAVDDDPRDLPGFREADGRA
jgi:hypothetical protein